MKDVGRLNRNDADLEIPKKHNATIFFVKNSKAPGKPGERPGDRVEILLCKGASVRIGANAGSNYLWTPATWLSSDTARKPWATPDSSITYYVSYTDLNGNPSTDSVIITVLPRPIVTLRDTSICPGDSVRLDAQNPGNKFIWSTHDTLQAIMAYGGTYSVTVTNSDGCANTASCTVSLLPKPVIHLSNDTICPGSATTLNAENPGATYHWSNNAITDSITVNTAGTYSVTVTGSNGCQDTASAKIKLWPQPIINLRDTSICPGQTVMLNAGNPGSFYHWSTGDFIQLITVDTTGVYSVTVTNSAHCSNIDSAVVSLYQTPTVKLNNKNICPGQTTILIASISGVSYHWSTGATTDSIIVGTQGDYSVTVTDAHGCTDRDTCSVTEKPKPVVHLNGKIICPGESAQLDADNSGFGYTYHWSTGDSAQAITVSAPGQYSVTVTNSVSCFDRDTALVQLKQAPVVTLTDTIYICPGDSATLDAGNPGFQYIWNTGATSEQITVNSDGMYIVTVTNGQNCTGSDTSTVIKKNILDVPLYDQTTCNGQPVTLDAGNPGSTYSWSTGERTETITTASSGTYSVTVTKSDSCKASKSATVTVNECPDKYNIAVPNAFSPNGDGLNDVLYVEGYGVDQMDFYVYNRWGQLVFHSSDLKDGWDGTFRGTKQDVETYVYFLKATFVDGKSVFKKGNITLCN